MTEARLVAKEGAGSGEHTLEGELTVGRDETADLVIDDPGISRRHATFSSDGSRITVEDLGSSNGTFVNGDRISGPVELADGDEIQVGATVFELRGDPDATNVIPPGAPPTEAHSGPPPAGEEQSANEPNIPALAAIFLGALSVLMILFGSGGTFYVALPVAVAAIVFGSIGKRRVDRGQSDKHRGLALAGQVFGIVGTILATIAIIALIIVTTVLDASAENIQEVIDAIQNEIDDAGGNAGDLIDQGGDAAGGAADQGGDAAGGVDAPDGGP